MNIKEIPMTNAANFMVNVSYAPLRPFRECQSDYSVLGLKAPYRGLRYACETITLLPQKPDVILLANIFQYIAHLGAIQPAFQPSTSP